MFSSDLEGDLQYGENFAVMGLKYSFVTDSAV